MFIALVACLVIIVSCSVIWLASRNIRRIAAMPRCPIGELGEATRARIAGMVARHGPWAVAPLTKRPCVY
jgi:hypothetical protein